MEGAHDLGGNYLWGGPVGFGSVDIEPSEPVFHASWEATAFALNLLALGKLRAYNADAYRHSIERMEPEWYLAASYYERVLSGVTTLLSEAGVVDPLSLQRRAACPIPLSSPPAPTPSKWSESTQVTQVSQRRSEDRPVARFSIGQTVCVVAETTPGHTRCPAYVRGATGVVVAVYPTAYLPELRAHTNVKLSEFTYAVEFPATALWVDSDAAQTAVVELFDSYLSDAPLPIAPNLERVTDA